MPMVEINNAAYYSLIYISRKTSLGKYKRLWMHNQKLYHK